VGLIKADLNDITITFIDTKLQKHPYKNKAAVLLEQPLFMD
jgi:RecB family exonuclease